MVKLSLCLIWQIINFILQPNEYGCVFAKWAIDLYDINNEQGEAVRVNDDRYRAMLNEFLFTKSEEEDIGNIWF